MSFIKNIKSMMTRNEPTKTYKTSSNNLASTTSLSAQTQKTKTTYTQSANTAGTPKKDTKEDIAHKADLHTMGFRARSVTSTSSTSSTTSDNEDDMEDSKTDSLIRGFVVGCTLVEDPDAADEFSDISNLEEYELEYNADGDDEGDSNDDDKEEDDEEFIILDNFQGGAVEEYEKGVRPYYEYEQGQAAEIHVKARESSRDREE